jgi:RsiW-degrading membrane proteinase PrsW (M82 family)
MGYFVGKAKFQQQAGKWITRLQGLAIAVLLHGAYDFLLFQDESTLLTFAVLPLIIASFVYCRKAMGHHVKASPFKE